MPALDTSTLEKLFRTAFSKYDPVTIVTTGPSDFAGYAKCVLSDGRIGMVRSPVVGQQYTTTEYPPNLVRYPNSDGFELRIHEEEPIDIPMDLVAAGDIRELYQHVAKIRKERIAARLPEAS